MYMFAGENYSVGQMVSQRHDANAITYWLTEWHKAVRTLPDEIVTDMSVALQNAVARFAASTKDIWEYIEKLHQSLEGNAPDFAVCRIRVDYAHLINDVRRMKALASERPRVKQFFLNTVRLLANCTTYDDAKNVIRDTLTVCQSEMEGKTTDGVDTACERAKRQLLSRMEGIAAEDEVELDDEVHTVAMDSQVPESSMTGWAFRRDAERLNHEVILTLRLQDEGDRDNAHYVPGFVEPFLRLIRTIPLWSKFVPGFSTTPSSAVAEAYFKNLKRVLFQKVELPMRLDVFLRDHIDLSDGQTKLAAGKVLASEFMSGRREPLFASEEEENWKALNVDKENSRKRGTTEEGNRKRRRTRSTFGGKDRQSDPQHVEQSAQVNDHGSTTRNEVAADEDVHSEIGANGDPHHFGEEPLPCYSDMLGERDWSSPSKSDVANGVHDTQGAVGDCGGHSESKQRNQDDQPSLVAADRELRATKANKLKWFPDELYREVRGIFHLQNGFKRPPVSINLRPKGRNFKIILKNTCPIDTVLSILACAALDRDVTPGEEFPIHEGLWALAMLLADRPKQSRTREARANCSSIKIYADRARLLLPLYDVEDFKENMKVLNCAVVLAVLLEKFEIISLTQAPRCTRQDCLSTIEVRKHHYVSIYDEELSSSSIEMSVEHFREPRPKVCPACGSSIEVHLVFAKVVVFEIVNDQKVRLSCLAKILLLSGKRYVLQGIIEQRGGGPASDLDTVVHYVAYTLRGDARWHQHNDLCNEAQVVSDKRLLVPKYLFFIRQ
jgi:hypothetical protein